MDAAGARAVFESLPPLSSDLKATIGVRGRDAYLKLESTRVDGGWVVVISDGVTVWLQTDEKYGHYEVTEDHDDDEYVESVRRFVGLASAYAQGHFAYSQSDRLKWPQLLVTVEGEHTTIALDIDRYLARLFGRGGR